MTTVGFGISSQQAASVSLGENTGALTPEERQRVNNKLGASVDKELPKSVKAAFGLNLDATKIVALTGALKASVRSKLSTSLGVTKEVGAGGSSGGYTTLAGAGGVQGAVSLGAKLGLNAGGGTAAGGEGTPLAGVKLASGTQPDAIPGLTAGITVFDPEAVKVRVSAAREVRADLDVLLGDALAGSGLSTQKQALVRAELEPQIGQALEESFRTSFGPNPQFPHAMGNRLLTAEVRMPRRGEWTANITLDQTEDGAAPPTGPFYFEIEGLEWRCSVIPGRSGRSQGFGRTSLRVVGGAGGLSHNLQVRNYGGGSTTGKTIVDDILRDAGETLSAETDSAILAKRVEAWQRVEGPGRRALDRICDKLGANWRILRDGTVWIGNDEWPEVEPDGTVLDDDWGDGSIMVAPDTPTMVPGIVVRGQRVEEVVHSLSRAGLRTTLRSVGVRSLMDQALEPVRHEAQYAKRYRCKVVSEDPATRRVNVLVDDERMRGRGVARCAVRVGIPGAHVENIVGARCLVGWDDGDPALPYVDGWESDTAESTVVITYPGGTRPAGGLGSMVRVILPFVPLPAPGPPVPFPVFGFMETGNEQNIT